MEKAGGITLHLLLHRLYPGYLSPDPNPRYGEFLTHEKLERLLGWVPFSPPAIGGHRLGSFLGYETVTSRRLHYFTFLREPLARYVSHLNWQRFVMGKDWTPDSFAAASHFNNYQCYRLCGKPDFELAKRQIEARFSFVGLLEYYDESLLMWGRGLGWEPHELHYQRANEKRYASGFTLGDMSDSLRERFRENNAGDLALYRWVTTEFYPRQVAAYGEARLAEEVGAFKAANEGFRFSRLTRGKRRVSNGLMKLVAQPLLFR